MTVHGYDFDGVVNMGEHGLGLRPRPTDVLITGRSFQDAPFVYGFLARHDIVIAVFFNPRATDDRTRETSGEHKVRTIRMLAEHNVKVDMFFEDDEVQADVIAAGLPDLNLIRLVHNMGRHG